jgi:hypothetical protein
MRGPHDPALQQAVPPPPPRPGIGEAAPVALPSISETGDVYPGREAWRTNTGSRYQRLRTPSHLPIRIVAN